MRMLVLADDLTGAVEVGAKFASEGIGALVTAELSLSPPCLESETAVLAVDTESRHLSPSDAARRIRILAAVARERGIRYVYKKTDSTLRGNIGTELEALSSAFGGLPVVYAPAYPQVGRTVERGRLLVCGRPVNETEHGADRLNPVRESHIPTLLASRIALPVHSTELPDLGEDIPAGINVLDGASDDDILACARHFLSDPALRLAAGPAAFAHGIARLVDWPRTTLSPLPPVKRCLIVNGSRSPVSERQIRHALATGFRSAPLSGITVEFSAASWLILTPETAGAQEPLEAARRTAEAVREALRRAAPDALVVFGGDTARAVVLALGSPGLKPAGEIFPGVPLSRLIRAGGHSEGFYLITKAGGFGPEDVVSTIFERLQRKDGA